MATKLIELEDGTFVEVEVPENQAQQISSRFADRVDSSFEKIKPILVKVSRPIAEVWQELNQDMSIEQAEVELGFSFTTEGNIYFTKANANATLKLKLSLKPKV